MLLSSLNDSAKGRINAKREIIVIKKCYKNKNK